MKKSIAYSPKLVIISESIRRDLHQPLRYFRRWRVFHLYSNASYQDMAREDFYNPRAIKFSGILDLYQKIAKIRPDILQTAEPWANRISLQISLVCFWYSLFYKVKLIFPVFENRPLNQKFSPFIARLFGWWVKILSSRASRIFYLNNGAKKNLLFAGVAQDKLQRANWGTWGIDIDEFKPGKEKATDKLIHPRLLFVGKISEAKGVPWILMAFNQLSARRSKIRLELAGPVEDKGIIAQIKLNDNIRYLGVVRNRDLPDLLRKASLVLTPSITTQTWKEQVGMVNLQAMASGTPVVSTRSGAIPEYIRDGRGCLLVKEKNSRDLKEAIMKFLQSPEFYRRQCRLARQWVKDNYEVKKNIRKLEKILMEAKNN